MSRKSKVNRVQTRYQRAPISIIYSVGLLKEKLSDIMNLLITKLIGMLTVKDLVKDLAWSRTKIKIISISY
jgi:hypothetical protein